jgi:BirA family biotin operon repressor/biotin-[acetyl-CoA-carboxylase] ligase
MDERRLRELLRGEAFVRQIVLLDRVGSTNDVARDLAARGADAGTVVLAEQQTAGRGRRGRAWHSPRGLGLFVSVLLRPAAPAHELTRWTLGAAVAACEACRRLTGADVAIEWPNDLTWNGKKLGGVLAEARTAVARPAELVVGAGVNVAHDLDDFPDGLSSCATSLRLACGGRAPERERLADAYLRRLAGIARELDRGAWAAVARRWERLSPGCFGKRVRVISTTEGAAGYEGVTTGLDATGALRVRRTDGRVGEVRLAESVLPLEA